MNPLLLGLGLLTTSLFCYWEWRRPDRRRLVARLLATLLAVVALAALSLSADNPTASSSQPEAALWTAGDPVSPVATRLPLLRFALPDATGTAPPRTPVVPDVGTLRRRFPALRALQIFGDGLDPAEISSLSGLQVAFQPPNNSSASPALRFLQCPRELPLGEPLVITGRLDGLPPGTNLPVSLEAPDGAKTETPTTSADARGNAAFTLRAAPLSAAGRFVWQLHAGPITEPLGVSVVPPVLPRVLILEGTPHFDTAALRRWYEAAGGALTVRTQVGKANTQFTAAQGNSPAFERVDDALLSGFDLVLADGTALTSLPPEQSAALSAAVEKTGLGLLVRADATLLPPDTPNVPPDLLPLFPWKLTPISETAPAEERPVRPRWPGQAATTEIPVAAAPFNLVLTDRQSTLVSDREDHALVASCHLGVGQVAVTLVRATTRWQRENEAGSFAAYWSHLFSRLARPAAAPGRWTLVDGDAGPVFVDHPLTLRWSGPPDGSPAPGAIVAADPTATTTLPLAQDEREPGTWSGTFWPRKPGWHRVSDARGGTPLDFYVHPADTWLVLQFARRRESTARFAAESAAPSAPSTSLPPASNHRRNPAWWFLLFVAAAGFLWTERRFTAPAARRPAHP